MKYVITYLTLIAFATFLSANAQNIDISPVSNIFKNSSMINPIVHDSTLYFASNAKSNFAVNYFDADGKHLFRIYKVGLRGNRPHGTPKPYFKYCNKPYSQIAIAFANNSAYVTQNNLQQADNDICPMGVFEYSNPNSHSDGDLAIAQPKGMNVGYVAYSQDGNLMIFASDMPGGEGGTDLYYRERKNGFWSAPQSMGSNINTEKTETTPFIHPSGKIFFASNGRSDSKRLDVYYTYRTEQGFSDPVRFDIVINSVGDDYGFYYSEDEDWGYVTSNRHGKERLYYFKQKFPEFPEAEGAPEENYCFTLYESSTENYDPNEFSFKWSFGDGQSAEGVEADHCFPGPGVYNVTLSAYDKVSREELFTVAEYPLELNRPEQIVINGKRTAVVGEKLTFEADGSSIKSFTPTYYYWDFGRKNKAKGKVASITFSRAGHYKIKCGTISEEDPSVRLCNFIEIDVTKKK